jgi:hypothetical protein
MATCRSSSENTGKMNLMLVFNKTSSRVHTESKLDMLGIPEKLVRYVVHSSRKELKRNFFFTQAAQTAFEF